tara:strand:- start:327 stop:695 length:369 start_codon:yes stop_codon:yes gene_type:complete
VEALARLERMHKNLDTGMTRLKYLNMCEQLEQEPIENEIPPDWEDFPEVVQHAINTFNQLGDRVFPEIGFVGKDYTNLSHYLEVYDVNDKEFFLEILSWLDSRAIKKSSEDLKRQYDKLKRK